MGERLGRAGEQDRARGRKATSPVVDSSERSAPANCPRSGERAIVDAARRAQPRKEGRAEWRSLCWVLGPRGPCTLQPARPAPRLRPSHDPRHEGPCAHVQRTTRRRRLSSLSVWNGDRSHAAAASEPVSSSSGRCTCAVGRAAGAVYAARAGQTSDEKLRAEQEPAGEQSTFVSRRVVRCGRAGGALRRLELALRSRTLSCRQRGSRCCRCRCAELSWMTHLSPGDAGAREDAETLLRLPEGSSTSTNEHREI